MVTQTQVILTNNEVVADTLSATIHNSDVENFCRASLPVQFIIKNEKPQPLIILFFGSGCVTTRNKFDDLYRQDQNKLEALAKTTDATSDFIDRITDLLVSSGAKVRFILNH